MFNYSNVHSFNLHNNITHLLNSFLSTYNLHKLLPYKSAHCQVVTPISNCWGAKKGALYTIAVFKIRQISIDSHSFLLNVISIEVLTFHILNLVSNFGAMQDHVVSIREMKKLEPSSSHSQWYLPNVQMQHHCLQSNKREKILKFQLVFLHLHCRWWNFNNKHHHHNPCHI